MARAPEGYGTRRTPRFSTRADLMGSLRSAGVEAPRTLSAQVLETKNLP